MINRERVILMTKMASYEENEGKKNIAICKYFRGDYIGWQMIKSAIAATVAFIVVLATYFLFHFENIMAEIYELDLKLYGKRIIFGYLAFLIGYCMLTYVVFSFRYKAAKVSLKRYFGNLKKLYTMLGKEGNDEDM